ncbi:MAG: VWA domain-containing protein [Deltaproteobacteria bacterium]|nr:VWA domain-containing protein [Deltaproteobacteria bacterium]
MWRWLPALLVIGCTEPRQGTVLRPGAAEVVAPGPREVECGRQRAALGGVVDASVLLVVDRSSSMATGSRWTETRSAIADAIGTHDRHLRVGLLLYPSGRDVCDQVEAEAAVPIALDTGEAIGAALASADIFRGTPTGAALRAAAELLAEDPGDHRVVILATDGRPDCTAQGWDDGSGVAATEAFDAADALAEDGVPVYVVGIEGSAAARAVLNRLADIGGTARPGDVGYYETTSGAELARALVDIALDVEGCSLRLDAHPEAVRMEVRLDGAPMAASDGWEVVDQRLRVSGAACLTSPGEVREVEVVWYCAEPAELKRDRAGSSGGGPARP